MSMFGKEIEWRLCCLNCAAVYGAGKVEGAPMSMFRPATFLLRTSCSACGGTANMGTRTVISPRGGDRREAIQTGA
jgi:hypothetical protein